MATIYYLNWDQETEEHGPATDLFHRITVKDVLEEDEKPGTNYSRENFDHLYREVASVDIDDPDALWEQWNRGSGYESTEFLNEQERSMSVGDVVEIDSEFYQVQSIGWEQIKVEQGVSE